MGKEKILSTPETSFLTSAANYCPICREPVEHFADLNGISRRHCPVCKSVERQRIFQLLYESSAFGEHCLRNKKMLHIAPGAAERNIFKNICGLDVVSVDIRPEMRADMTADISNLTEIPDNTFDIVFACYVFACTKYFRKTLKELHRVLKKDGVLLCYDALQSGENTVELSDQTSIEAYYGNEAYNKYSIGTFRQFGECDYVEQFSPYFSGTLHAETDPATGIRCHWFYAKRMHLASAEIVITSEKKLLNLLADYLCKKHTSRQGHALALAAQPEEENVLKLYCCRCTRAQFRDKNSIYKTALITENDISRVVATNFYDSEILISEDTYDGFASESFDFIYAPMALQKISIRQIACQNLYRIARPGGCVILIHNLNDSGVSHSNENVKQELHSLCASTGFFVADYSKEYDQDGQNICLLLIRSRDALNVDTENIVEHMTYAPPLTQVSGAQWPLLAQRSFNYPLSVLGQRREYELTVQLPDMTITSSNAPFHFAHHGRLDGLLAVGTGYLAYSCDFGLSWTRIPVPQHEHVRFHKAFCTSTGNIIAQSVNKDWSAEGLYLFDAEHNLVSRQEPLSTHCWHGQHSIGEADGIIMFADYRVARKHDKLNVGGQIFRSCDDGRSWEAVLTVKNITHFHLLKPDPGKAHCWWACSGDFDFQSRWWFSSDDGNTWQERTSVIMEALAKTVPDLNQSCLRTTDICFVGNGLLWGTDDSLGRKSRLMFLADRFNCTGAQTLADIGPLIRNIIRHDDQYFLLTEGLQQYRCLPEVWAFHLWPFSLTRIAQIPSWSVKPKMSLSTASPHTVDGVFYTLRGWEDMFAGNLKNQMLRWTVRRIV